MPRTRRTTEELRQHAAAAAAAAELLQQQQRRGRPSRQAAIDSRQATASQVLALRGIVPSGASDLASSAADQYRRAHQQQTASHHQALQQAVNSLGVEVMSYGGRGNQVGGTNPHNMHANKQMPLSAMAFQQTGVSGGQSRGYSSAVASAAGLTMPYSAAAAAALSAQQLTTSYPINPDVKLKKLPFYDILAELLKPSSLAPQGSGRYQESGFSFSLTPQQANKIANSRDLRPGKQDYNVQVQMRFCLLETSCEQEDNFPPNIAVKINDKMCPLPSPIPTNKPGVEPKRPSRPVNITALCRISPTVTNRVLVSWASEYGRCYVISVYLVQKLSSDDLLHRLKSKGVRIADFTRSLIKQKLNEDADCEIATTSLRCSLMCPLGKMRMLLPCRANTCNHLQCFDASLYLQMNERKPTWTCPVCDKPAIYDTLVIDGYFQEVLRLNTTSNEVTLHKDGAWSPLLPKKERPEPQAEKRKSVVAIETLSDSDDDTPSAGNKMEYDDSVVEEVEAVGVAKKKASDVEIITLESSSEEEDDDEDASDEEVSSPPAKRPYNPAQASTAATITPVDAPVNGSGDGNGQQDTSLSPPPPVVGMEDDAASPQQGDAAVISPSVASSLAQLPAATSVLTSTPAAAASPPTGNGQQDIASPSSPNTAAAPQQLPQHSPTGSDGGKSDDSWSVGTVDPGKRLVFRKSMSCSSNGTSATTTATANGDSSTKTTTSGGSCVIASTSPSHPLPLSPTSPSEIGADKNNSVECGEGGTLSDDGGDKGRPTRTSNRATRFQGITWEGDSDTGSDDNSNARARGRKRRRSSTSVGAAGSEPCDTDVAGSAPVSDTSPDRDDMTLLDHHVHAREQQQQHHNI